MRDGLDSRVSRDHVVVLALAGLVHLVTLLLASLLVVLLLSSIAWGFKAFFDLLLLGVLWEVGPWPRGRYPHGFALTEQQAPELHSLVADVGTRLGVRPPSVILISEDVNAGWGSYGWHRRRFLVLGLPLWAALNSQGKVSLLGHELGHEASGDLSRLWFAGSAVVSLGAWQELLFPSVGEANGSPMSLIVYLTQLVLVLVMLPVVALVGVLQLVLGTLALRSGQRAEHVADRLGARLAGRKGALDAEEVVVHTDSLAFAVSVSLRRDPEADVWATAREHLASVPGHEHRRQLALASRTLQRIDASHPPTTRRLELLAAMPETAPELVLEPARETAIDAEIRQAHAWVRRRLRDMA